jgi:immune inhibitor A
MCTSSTDEQTYEDGATVCIANPAVVKGIRKAVKAGRLLSAGDVRLARNMGMLSIPTPGRTGWNDGVIFPTDDFPVRTRAGRAARTGVKRVLAPSTTGRLHALVLLVDFSDNVGRTPPAHFEKLLFDRTNPDSMSSLYHELSYGKLNVTGEVVGWLRAPQPYGFYTNGESGTSLAFPNNTPGLLHNALTQFTATRSLSDFDLNGDGFVDGLFIIHAGGGAESDPNPARRRDKIWSHKWTLPTPFVQRNTKAFAYFTAPEDGRLGVFAHEFGHFLGLPDLYDTTYRSNGIGDWCLMAGGSWNGNGDRPARLSAWCLAQLGWVTPKNVRTTRTLTLDTLDRKKGDCYRLWSAGSRGAEYFLIENRQQRDRDDRLPGNGLAVWHIDETQSDNTNPTAFRVALVQADGKRDLETARNEGDSGDLYPGRLGVTSVTGSASVEPNLRANSGGSTSVSLTAIAQQAAGTVKVRVKV